MFFRRERPQNPSFQERLSQLRQNGFQVKMQPAGGVQVSRNGIAAVLSDANGQVRLVEQTGVLMDGEIGALVDGGFQKFFRTPSGRQKPAIAAELRAIHDFEEDLREGLGQDSLYNESLGTVSTFYLYDRLKDRDHGVPKRVWE